MTLPKWSFGMEIVEVALRFYVGRTSCITRGALCMRNESGIQEHPALTVLLQSVASASGVST
jgi:hypothetical protein